MSETTEDKVRNWWRTDIIEMEPPKQMPPKGN